MADSSETIEIAVDRLTAVVDKSLKGIGVLDG